MRCLLRSGHLNERLPDIKMKISPFGTTIKVNTNCYAKRTYLLAYNTKSSSQ